MSKLSTSILFTALSFAGGALAQDTSYTHVKVQDVESCEFFSDLSVGPTGGNVAVVITYKNPATPSQSLTFDVKDAVDVNDAAESFKAFLVKAKICPES